jgi:formate hydrogenlyase subunit 6/NADH:ubiquinone oxidoreductase subunit I
MRRCVLCGACLIACPELAIGLAPDASGAASAVWIDDLRCTRCGLCEEACPEVAIACPLEIVLGEA